MNPAPPVIKILLPISIEPCITASHHYARASFQQLGRLPLLFTRSIRSHRRKEVDRLPPLRNRRRVSVTPVATQYRQSFTPLDRPYSRLIGYASWTQTPCLYSRGENATATATFASQL